VVVFGRRVEMSSRRLLTIFGLSAVIWLSSGIPTESQDESAFTQAGAVLKAGRNVNMVSGNTLPNGDPWLQRQNEPSIAVSTRNTLHLLAGANDYRTVDMPLEGVGGELPGKDGKMQAPHDAWLGVFKSFDGGNPGRAPSSRLPQDKSAQGWPLRSRDSGRRPTRWSGPAPTVSSTSGIAFTEKGPGQANSVCSSPGSSITIT
jgi:hypothetical protein